MSKPILRIPLQTDISLLRLHEQLHAALDSENLQRFLVTVAKGAGQEFVKSLIEELSEHAAPSSQTPGKWPFPTSVGTSSDDEAPF